MMAGHQKVIMPARIETAKYRQSLIAAGGTAPMRHVASDSTHVAHYKRQYQYSEDIESTLDPRRCSA
jgi:hypothetical protein